ncbi:MAG: hypothetical protein JW834_00030 [Candidatus Diapherotrites archaeon]|nr:hypothetical protein [Candidatus Diapherotrites archaeon]
MIVNTDRLAQARRNKDPQLKNLEDLLKKVKAQYEKTIEQLREKKAAYEEDEQKTTTDIEETIVMLQEKEEEASKRKDWYTQMVETIAKERREYRVKHGTKFPQDVLKAFEEHLRTELIDETRRTDPERITERTWRGLHLKFERILFEDPSITMPQISPDYRVHVERLTSDVIKLAEKERWTREMQRRLGQSQDQASELQVRVSALRQHHARIKSKIEDWEQKIKDTKKEQRSELGEIRKQIDQAKEGFMKAARRQSHRRP